MGLGDQLMATGMARGAKERGKRIAFGDGRRIIWDGNSPAIFRNNPNIAPPGTVSADLEWVPFYKGSRLYNSHDPVRRRWVWNKEFKAIPGEVFLDEVEVRWAETIGSDFVVIQPNLPWHKSVSPNKDWGRAKYQMIADALSVRNDVLQFDGREKLRGVRVVTAPSFRHALAALARARLYIGPEGGLHHGAAAMGTPAVVLFGGFIPPSVTGYDMHTNLTGGAEACGSLETCQHCRGAMEAITPDDVYDAARKWLKA